MSIISTAVRHLMAAGVTGEALVDAIADMEAAQPKDAAAEKRRAWDRERKRAAKTAQSGGNPVESTESAELVEAPALSPSPKEINSNPHPHTHPDITTRARGAVAKPDDVSQQTWIDWVAHRRRIKADVTPTAVAGVRSEATKVGWTMEAALTESVTQGWRGFKAKWIEAQQATGPPANSNRPQRGSSIASLLDDVRQVHGL
jgi:hypothetical protein